MHCTVEPFEPPVGPFRSGPSGSANTRLRPDYTDGNSAPATECVLEQGSDDYVLRHRETTPEP